MTQIHQSSKFTRFISRYIFKYANCTTIKQLKHQSYLNLKHNQSSITSFKLQKKTTITRVSYLDCKDSNRITYSEISIEVWVCLAALAHNADGKKWEEVN